MILWERACSRIRCFSRCIFGACAGPFASKLAPTGPECFKPCETLTQVRSVSSHVDALRQR
ncbi:hypothetical protein BKM09_007065 [Pseudomonas amygdali pv. morsprunorum]|nr:hypothetical protein BKM19_024320 [Pseudomonas amygdali pv. morsprunorum]POP92497.1 hypothetical protein CXB39_16405 [Pseudomonas amygdali pv. morsprunorum]POY78671.1 hypothetical protein BKM09_007065 [Pseudomonas amygdali pv. morsprunorum]